MQVAISNEKPVPSLQSPSWVCNPSRLGCNLKREARSLATSHPSARGMSTARLQSQTRSPFPRYLDAFARGDLTFLLQSQTRSPFPRYGRGSTKKGRGRNVAISNEKPVPSLLLIRGRHLLPCYWLQSQTRSPFPRYEQIAERRKIFKTVAISNEKPVPSLPRCSRLRMALAVSCNLKREARSLATPRLHARAERLAGLQSQTRSPFPRYPDRAHFRRFRRRVAISNEKPVPSLRENIVNILTLYHLLQSQTRSPFPRYEQACFRGGLVVDVAISNEKPVPSLL